MRTFGGMIMRPIKNKYRTKTNKIVNRERQMKKELGKRRKANKAARAARRFR